MLVLVLAFMAKTATALGAAFVACLLTWLVTRSGAAWVDNTNLSQRSCRFTLRQGKKGYCI